MFGKKRIITVNTLSEILFDDQFLERDPIWSDVSGMVLEFVHF